MHPHLRRAALAATGATSAQALSQRRAAQRRERPGTCVPPQRRLAPDLRPSFAQRGSSSPVLAEEAPSRLQLARHISTAKIRIDRAALIHRNTFSVFDEYDLETCVGKGSNGEVWKAKHRRTGIPRALKKLVMEGLEKGQRHEQQEEFMQELGAMVLMDHPHVVKVLEYFFEEHALYLVEELCTGNDLFDMLQASPKTCRGAPILTERQASITVRQCIKAIAGCHVRGIAHRDVKLDNFIVTGDEKTVKLIDFGFAVRYSDSEAMQDFVGTEEYMAPEVLMRKFVTKASDVWSLGIILYILLTGELFLPESLSNTVLGDPSFAKKRLDGSRALRVLDVSLEVRDLLEQMLEPNPNKRIGLQEALDHPFMRMYALQGLADDDVGPGSTTIHVDEHLVSSMESFAHMTQLKQIGYMTVCHVAQAACPELAKARNVFSNLDRHGTGEITYENLVAAMKDLGVELPKNFQKIFEGCDTTLSGKLTYIEFLACNLKEDLIKVDAILEDAYRILDRDKSGALDAEDFAIMCPNDASTQELLDMVKEADPTGNGIRLEDFKRLIRS